MPLRMEVQVGACCTQPQCYPGLGQNCDHAHPEGQETIVESRNISQNSAIGGFTIRRGRILGSEAKSRGRGSSQQNKPAAPAEWNRHEPEEPAIKMLFMGSIPTYQREETRELEEGEKVFVQACEQLGYASAAGGHEILVSDAHPASADYNIIQGVVRFAEEHEETTVKVELNRSESELADHVEVLLHRFKRAVNRDENIFRASVDLSDVVGSLHGRGRAPRRLHARAEAPPRHAVLAALPPEVAKTHRHPCPELCLA